MSNKIIDKTTKSSKMAEILAMPGGEEILAKYKVPCLTCPFAQSEMDLLTIGDVCKMYGIDVEKILSELNKNAEQK